MDTLGLSQNATLVLLAIALATLVYLLPKRDPREPPLAPSTIPYISHIYGLIRHKSAYYVTLRQTTSSPIFTLPLPGINMYIATSPPLIQTIQKQPKTLSFAPLEAKFACRAFAISSTAREIVWTNVNGEDGDWGLSMEMYALMRTTLAPGAALDELTRLMLPGVVSSLNHLIPKDSRATKVGLWEWARETVTLSTTNAVYGPHNPFQDVKIRDSFWHFEKDFTTILLAPPPFPSILARPGLQGRESVVRAIASYFQQKQHLQGSTLIQSRFSLTAEKGFSIEDNARFEVGGAIAILVNTAPPIFWILLLIYSTPSLLAEIRSEVTSIITTSQDASVDGEGKRRVLDVTDLRTRCPLLASTYQETLRYRSVGSSVRLVMEDTLLDNQYLIKKSNIILIPSRVLHTDAEIWGPDAEVFNPRRFLKSENGKKASPLAFRAFGGGTTLCPGRHFAGYEILATVAMFVCRFEMTPVGGKGWVLPETGNTNVVATIMEPDSDVEVEISLRSGWGDGKWGFGFKGSETFGDVEGGGPAR